MSYPHQTSAAEALCRVYQWIVWSFRQTLTPTYPVGVSGVRRVDDVARSNTTKDGNGVIGQREAVRT